MKTLLIMTVGQTDVQLVVDGQRHKLDGNTCGVLHDELIKRKYSIVDTPELKKDSEKESPRHSLPEGDLSICTPKLDAVLRYFGETLPTNALVLETRRTRKSDPRFAGSVLEQKLKENCGIAVRLHTYLRDQEDYDDRNTPEDAVVRRSVVADLSKVIAEEITTHKPTKVLLATVGGPPPVTDVINELVRLHAVGRAEVVALDTPENRMIAVEEKFHPAAGYRARWHALSLIEKGSFIGAWGAVSHLVDAPGQDWVKVVKWLYNFASSLPNEGCEIEVLKHPRMAVRAALRVELALRAGDIPRAVHGTVAFYESALWDHLLDRFERTGQRQRGLEELRLKTEVPVPTGEKLLRNEQRDEKEKRNCPFERLENGNYLFFEDGAGRFARDYVKSQPLKSLLDAVEKVKQLRNDVAHNEPTPKFMENARRQMQNVALWSSSDTFLSQPLVQEVLKELGEQCPEQLCNNLLLTVRERLLAIS